LAQRRRSEVHPEFSGQHFDKNRRAILNASMVGCRGKIQHADYVIH
jgi:hypothetical protein